MGVTGSMRVIEVNLRDSPYHYSRHTWNKGKNGTTGGRKRRQEKRKKKDSLKMTDSSHGSVKGDLHL